jgi:hypothetical protein
MFKGVVIPAFSAAQKPPSLMALSEPSKNKGLVLISHHAMYRGAKIAVILSTKVQCPPKILGHVLAASKIPISRGDFPLLPNLSLNSLILVSICI